MISTDFFNFNSKTRTLTADSEDFHQYFVDQPETEPNLNVLANDKSHVFVLKDERTGHAINMVRTSVNEKNDNGEILSEEYQPLNPQDNLWFDRVVIVAENRE